MSSSELILTNKDAELWKCCEKLLLTSLSSFCLLTVVTGATDGIGKSYAEEVRLLDSYLSHFFHTERKKKRTAMTHSHTHTHTVLTQTLVGESSYRSINVEESPLTHMHTHLNPGLSSGAGSGVTGTRWMGATLPRVRLSLCGCAAV